MIDDSKFTYDKQWKQILQMLEWATIERNIHKKAINGSDTSMRDKAQHMRDYKGLQGVTYALRWVLGDPTMSGEQVLGREK